MTTPSVIVPPAGNVVAPFEPKSQVLLLLLIVNPALAVNSPDTLMASLICMADESSELIVFVIKVLAFNVPLTFTPSLICMAVLSSDSMVLATRVFFNTILPVPAA